jgi:hypothetical protein
MNIRFTVVFFILSFALSTFLFATEPFAAKVNIPENPDNDPDLALAIMFLKNIKVPDKEAVGLPAYPEAQIFQTTPAQAGMLPTVRLLTDDKIEKVVEFYKKELDEWKYKDFYGVFMFFYGDETEAMMGQIPVIQIEDAEKFTNILPSAKTAITIGYELKEGDSDKE